MPRMKSLITRVEIDEAKRAHNCQANSRHRIERGDKRLNVRNDRSWNRYCLDCAEAIVQRDLELLKELQKKLSSDTV